MIAGIETYGISIPTENTVEFTGMGKGKYDTVGWR